MKNGKIKLILVLILSLTLFVVGFYSFGAIYESLLPRVDNGFYQVTNFIGLFDTSLIPALVIGLTPVFIWKTGTMAHITSRTQTIYTILIVIICMTTAVLLRREMIKLYFARLINTTDLTNNNSNLGFPLNKVNFEYYMFSGLIVGCLLSYLLLRQRKAG